MDNKVNETLKQQVVGLEQLEKKVSLKLDSIWSRMPYFSAIGLALLVVGLFQFASVGFDPTALLKVEFWHTHGKKEYLLVPENEKSSLFNEAAINERNVGIPKITWEQFVEFLDNKEIDQAFIDKYCV
jgi:hypothetical protein